MRIPKLFQNKSVAAEARKLRDFYQGVAAVIARRGGQARRSGAARTCRPRRGERKA